MGLITSRRARRRRLRPRLAPVASSPVPKVPSSPTTQLAGSCASQRSTECGGAGFIVSLELKNEVQQGSLQGMFPATWSQLTPPAVRRFSPQTGFRDELTDAGHRHVQRLVVQDAVGICGRNSQDEFEIFPIA